ncbi:MAG: hypothetical protein R2873_14375 [Caldilineaceae bacterium]
MSAAKPVDRPTAYRIIVQGALDQRWSDWFDGFTITLLANGQSCMTGVVADQAALHGILAKLWNLGLPILLVQEISGDTPHIPARRNPPP